MKIQQDKKYSHWAYSRDGDCYLGEIRRNMEESADFPNGWRVIATNELEGVLPHEIMLYEGRVIFRGRPYQILFLENWFYQRCRYTRGRDVFMTEKLHAEMNEIPEDRDLDIDSIVARLNYGYDRTEAESQQCKKWLLEWQAANQRTARELDDFCFHFPAEIFEQVFSEEA